MYPALSSSIRSCIWMSLTKTRPDSINYLSPRHNICSILPLLLVLLWILPHVLPAALRCSSTHKHSYLKQNAHTTVANWQLPAISTITTTSLVWLSPVSNPGLYLSMIHMDLISPRIYSSFASHHDSLPFQALYPDFNLSPTTFKCTLYEPVFPIYGMLMLIMLTIRSLLRTLLTSFYRLLLDLAPWSICQSICLVVESLLANLVSLFTHITRNSALRSLRCLFHTIAPLSVRYSGAIGQRCGLQGAERGFWGLTNRWIALYESTRYIY